jgi:hypothetical protein
MTPPKVPDTPYPASSVMIRRMFGAPSGGTTRGGQYGVDCSTLRSIVPPNSVSGGGGSCFPSMVVVALGDPGVPVTSWADAHNPLAINPMNNADVNTAIRLDFTLFPLFL